MNFKSFVPVSMIPAVMLTALMAVFQALPAGWREWMPYERIPLSQGQFWRPLTSNFIHLSWGHLAMNACGLLAIAWLFAEDRRTSQWISDLGICSVVTSAGLYFFNPEVAWCVGLSGALHGLFLIGAVGWITGGIGQGKWLLAGLGAKLTWEQTVGEMPFSGGIIGGNVVTDAHLWGALGGLLALLADRLWQRIGARL